MSGPDIDKGPEREEERRGKSREAAGRNPHPENGLQFLTELLALCLQPLPGLKGISPVVHEGFPAVLKV